jgi:anti-anti-sigma factor
VSAAARVELLDVEGVAVLRVAGDLDVATVDLVQERLVEAQAPGRAGLVLDLAAVGFLDSAGVHLLFGLVRRGEGARVAFLVPPGTHARRVVEIAGLPLAAPVCASLEEACASVGDGPPRR